MSKVERGKEYNHLIGQKISSISSNNNSAFIKIWKDSPSRYADYSPNIDGKTFRVDSVAYDVYYYPLRNSGYVFYLSECNNPNNKLGIIVHEDYERIANQSWVCLGYYEKIKQLYLGKELVYVWNDYGWSDGFVTKEDRTSRFMDYDTGYNLAKKIPCNTIWTCTDVMVLPVLPQERVSLISPSWRNRVILNIENQEYGKYYIFAAELLSTQNYFMTLEQFNAHKAIQNQKYAEAKARAEAEAKKRAEWRAKQLQKLIDKYGEDIGYRIHNGEIWIGMTSTQCSESIGSPQRINRTTTMRGSREQWVYHSQYLYFENGILVTIQD